MGALKELFCYKMLLCDGECFEKEMSIVFKESVVLMEEEGCVYLWFS